MLLVGFFAATFGAALETALSCGYTVGQYFGFQWGKLVRPAEAPRFHLVTLVPIVLGAGLVLSTLDPIKVTEYSIVLSAAALPLTYFPIRCVGSRPSRWSCRGRPIGTCNVLINAPVRGRMAMLAPSLPTRA